MRIAQQSIGVVFVTHCSKKHLIKCLPPILQSPLKPRVLIMNSSSQDGTVEEAKTLGAEVLVIPRDEFNHGLSREVARRHLKTDIVVMMTPDAYATSPLMLENLLKPILEKKAAVAYAKQIPHDGANFLESQSRFFNYPDVSHIRSLEDLALWGVYTIFCSNCCAAWDNRSLDEIGGFRPILTGEDTLAAAMILKKGHRIAYVAEAVVKHSHHYTPWQEFRRYFDTGYARKEQKELQDIILKAGKDKKRGKAFFQALIKKTLHQQPSQIPKVITHSLAKILGYQIGSWSLHAPLWFKQFLSSQDFYWTSKVFLEKKKNST